ncbi:hypothetical protein SEA_PAULODIABOLI_365 [Microbacterium phage PauloDiaboli]|nr:hypothetical protein SEA_PAULODIABOLI_10 [Microbacterium phage PauloDiaboli]QIG58049.1 hypothetical protein SEA_PAULODIABOLI_365 [Microbacterium phage PauloDiaboli]
MSAGTYTAEEMVWIKNGKPLNLNPIVEAFGQNLLDFRAGTTAPEDGFNTETDVMVRWIDYMADGNQEISWHPGILAQANKFFKRVAEVNGLEYRPGMTKAAS